MKTTYVEAIRQAIWEEMDRDESVYILGEDVGIAAGGHPVVDGDPSRGLLEGEVTHLREDQRQLLLVVGPAPGLGP